MTRKNWKGFDPQGREAGDHYARRVTEAFILGVVQQYKVSKKKIAEKLTEPF